MTEQTHPKPGDEWVDGEGWVSREDLEAAAEFHDRLVENKDRLDTSVRIEMGENLIVVQAMPKALEEIKNAADNAQAWVAGQDTAHVEDLQGRPLKIVFRRAEEA